MKSKRSLLLALSLLGASTMILSGVIACGGAEEGDDGTGAAGGLGSYVPGSAASQAPTAPGAKFPEPNPNSSSSSTSSTSSTSGATDAGGSSSGGSTSSSSGSASSSSGGGMDGGDDGG